MARTAAAVAAPARRQAPRPTPKPKPTPARRPARRASGPAVATPRRGRVALPLGARMLDALLSGRMWIGLVGVLLAGIVFFNVDLLRMNREITHMADHAAQLKRENARLREDVAGLANSERIQQAAAELGLVLPAPAEVRYLKSNPTIDAHTASKRIIAPTPTEAPTPVVPETQTITPPTTTTSPTSTAATVPTG